MSAAATTGHIFTLTQQTADADSSGLSGPYTFPSSISTLAVKKLLPHSLVLLADGIIHCTRSASASASSAPPSWLSACITAWNGSKERSSSVIVDLQIGSSHLLLLTSAGLLFTLGDNAHGQRGLGHRDQATPAVSAVPKLSSLPAAAVVTAIATGSQHCLALTSSGDVYAFGRNAEGQLFTAPSSSPFLTSPAYVSALRDRCIVKLGCRGNYSVCLDALGVLWYAGNGLLRQLSPSVPQQLTASAAVASFALGSGHLLALTSPSSPGSRTAVLVMGDNVRGQLGFPASTRRLQLTELSGDWSESASSAIAAVFAGSFSSFLLTQDARVVAFGSNQGGKLGAEAEQAALSPQPVAALSAQRVSDIVCSSSTVAVFVPTRIEAVSPTFLSSAGGTELRLDGVGIFAHSFPMSASFSYEADPTVTATVDATYDIITGGVRCTSPALPPLLLPTDSASASSGAPQCEVRVSINSKQWSPPFPVFVYGPPDWQHSSLWPTAVCWDGGYTVRIRAELERLPYSGLLVRLCLDDGDSHEVDASYDAQRHELSFVSPAVAAGSASLRASLSVSFNSQQYHLFPLPLSFYHLTGWSCDRQTLSVVPTATRLRVEGCALHRRVRVKLQVKTETGAEELVVDADWTGEEEQRQTERAQEAKAAAEEEAQLTQAAELRQRLGRAEEEKDDDERRRDEDFAQQQARQAAEIAARSSERLRRYEEEDAAWTAIPEKERAGRGTVAFLSPSLLHLCPSSACLLVSVNEQDWHDTGLELRVDGPRVERVVPCCGPVSGETQVEVLGEGLFNADSVTVSLACPRPPSPTVASPTAEAVEEKDAKGKGSRAAAASVFKPAASPRSAPRNGKAAETPATAATVPVDSPPVQLPATFCASSSAAPLLASVLFTTPPQPAGVRNVLLSFISGSSSFSTPPSAALSSSSSPSPACFTFYSAPSFTDISPAVLSVWGEQEVAIAGRGLFPSADIRVRLTVKEEEAEAAETTRPAAASSAAAGSRAKQAAAAGGKDRAKSEEQKREEEDALREEEERKAREEDRRRRGPLSITLPARFRAEEEELRSPKAGRSAGKAGKGAKEEAAAGGCVVFSAPCAAVGWEAAVAGAEELRGLEAMVGRTVSVSVAMNGQQFVSTALQLRYERDLLKSATGAAASKKAQQNVAGKGKK